MKKFVAALSVFTTLAAPASAWTRPDVPEAPDDNAVAPNAWSVHDRVRAQLHEIAARLHRPDPNYAIMAQHLREVVENPYFTSLSPREQHYAYLVYGGALFSSGEFALARPQLERASAMDDAGAADWQFRLNNSMALQDYTDAALAATTLARRWPAALARYDDGVFAAIVAGLRSSSPGLATDLLAALAAAHRYPAARSG